MIIELSPKPTPKSHSLTPAQLSALGFRKAKKKGQSAPLPCLHLTIDPVFLIEVFLWFKVEIAKKIGQPPGKPRQLNSNANLEEIVEFLLSTTYKKFIWIKHKRFWWDMETGLCVFNRLAAKIPLSESEKVMWF